MVSKQMKMKNWSELTKQAPERFKPRPYYDADSDSVTLFITDEESYRERIDGYLTVYRSLKSNDVVGCHVKCVKKMLATVQAFDVDIETSKLSLGLLLLAVPWAELQDQEEPLRFHSRVYREAVTALAKSAESTRVKIPELV